MKTFTHSPSSHAVRPTSNRIRRTIAVTFLFCAGAAITLASCGDDESDGTASKPPPTPAERLCELAKRAIESCAGATACDKALVQDCAGIAGMLSDPYLAAAADCIEAGGAPLSCLASAASALTPTDAHRAFAKQFCKECAFGLPGCEDAFFGSEPGSETAIAGALILPLGDSLVTGIQNECATGLKCATFPSCAQGVLAKQALPEATLQCLVDSLTGSSPSGAGGGSENGSGDCTLGSGGAGPTGGPASGAGTSGPGGGGTGGAGPCGARGYGECTSCSETKCCSLMKACDDGTPCGNLVHCENECADVACLDACEAAHPDGVASLDAWDTCVQASCVAAKSCDLGGVCGTGLVSYDAGGPCDQCVNGACCGAVNACMGADVNACLDCLSGGSCTPAGTNVLTCLSQNCLSQCSN